MSEDALKGEIVGRPGADEEQGEQRIACKAKPKSTQGRRPGYAVPNTETRPNPQVETAKLCLRDAPKPKTKEQERSEPSEGSREAEIEAHGKTVGICGPKHRDETESISGNSQALPEECSEAENRKALVSSE
jgi:hypothetical protein